MPESAISEATFSNLFLRLNEFIRVNGSLIFIGQWAKQTAQPLMRDWLGQLATGLPALFPLVFGHPPEDPLAVAAALDAVAGRYHRDGVLALEAVTLVVGHTVSDAIVDELLEISAKGVPSRWHIRKEEFKVTVDELERLSLSKYVDKALERVVQRQKSKALPEKVQHLFTVSGCGPKSFGKELDFALLSEADQTRHKIIHEAAFGQPLERRNDMLGVLLTGTELAILAVAFSCSYQYVPEEVGFVFRPIADSTDADPPTG